MEAQQNREENQPNFNQILTPHLQINPANSSNLLNNESLTQQRHQLEEEISIIQAKINQITSFVSQLEGKTEEESLAQNKQFQYALNILEEKKNEGIEQINIIFDKEIEIIKQSRLEDSEKIKFIQEKLQRLLDKEDTVSNNQRHKLENLLNAYQNEINELIISTLNDMNAEFNAKKNSSDDKDDQYTEANMQQLTKEVEDLISGDKNLTELFKTEQQLRNLRWEMKEILLMDDRTSIRNYQNVEKIFYQKCEEYHQQVDIIRKSGSPEQLSLLNKINELTTKIQNVQDKLFQIKSQNYKQDMSVYYKDWQEILEECKKLEDEQVMKQTHRKKLDDYFGDIQRAYNICYRLSNELQDNTDQEAIDNLKIITEYQNKIYPLFTFIRENIYKKQVEEQQQLLQQQKQQQVQEESLPDLHHEDKNIEEKLQQEQWKKWRDSVENRQEVQIPNYEHRLITLKAQDDEEDYDTILKRVLQENDMLIGDSDLAKVMPPSQAVVEGNQHIRNSNMPNQIRADSNHDFKNLLRFDENTNQQFFDELSQAINQSFNNQSAQIKNQYNQPQKNYNDKQQKLNIEPFSQNNDKKDYLRDASFNENQNLLPRITSQTPKNSHSQDQQNYQTNINEKDYLKINTKDREDIYLKNIQNQIQNEQIEKYQIPILTPNSWYLHDNILYSIEPPADQALQKEKMNKYIYERGNMAKYLEDRKYSKPDEKSQYIKTREKLTIYETDYINVKESKKDKAKKQNQENNNKNNGGQIEDDDHLKLILSMYLMPNFTKVRQFKLPFTHISKKCKITVSESGHFQIFDPSCAIFFNRSNLDSDITLDRLKVLITTYDDISLDGIDVDKLIGAASLLTQNGQDIKRIVFFEQFCIEMEKSQIQAMSYTYNENQYNIADVVLVNNCTVLLKNEKIKLKNKNNITPQLLEKSQTRYLVFDYHDVGKKHLRRGAVLGPLDQFMIEANNSHLMSYLTMKLDSNRKHLDDTLVLEVFEKDCTHKQIDINKQTQLHLFGDIKIDDTFIKQTACDEQLKLVFMQGSSQRILFVFDFSTQIFQQFVCTSEANNLPKRIQDSKHLLNNTCFSLGIVKERFNGSNVIMYTLENQKIRLKNQLDQQSKVDNQYGETLKFVKSQFVEQPKEKSMNLIECYKKKDFRLKEINQQKTPIQSRNNQDFNSDFVQQYHKILAMNDQYIWRVELLVSNKLKFTKYKIDEESTGLCIPIKKYWENDKQMYCLRSNIEKSEIEDIFFSKYQMLIIFQEKYKDSNFGILYNYFDIQNPFPHLIRNIHSIISLEDDALIYVQFNSNNRKNDQNLSLVKLRINHNTRQLFEVQNLNLKYFIREGYDVDVKFSKYYTRNPSYYNFTYKNQTLVLQFFQKYILLFDVESFKFLGSFEFSLKNYYIEYSEENIYLVEDIPFTNQPFQKLYSHSRFLEGIIESVIRLSINKMHIIIDMREQKMRIVDAHNQEISYISMNHNSIIESSSQHYLVDQTRLSDPEIHKYIKGLDMDQLTQHTDQENTTFLHQIIKFSAQTLDIYAQRLQTLSPQVAGKFPLLLMKNLQNQTVLDIAIQDNYQYQKVQILFDIIIKYQNQTFFNEVIDKHLCFLLKQKFSLREYFESDLPMSKIVTTSFSETENHEIKQIISDFDQEEHVTYIFKKYKQLADEQHSINHDLKINNSYKQNKSEEVEIKTQIEYHLINMPETLTNPNFIEQLALQDDMEIFETPLIQTIINFKWHKYTQKFFIFHFCLFMVFLMAYITDIYFIIVSQGIMSEESNYERNLGHYISPKIICLIYIIIMEIFEAQIVYHASLKIYMEDVWNLNDQIFAVLYIAIVIVDLSDASIQGLIIMHSIMIMVLFIKLCQNLRIFQGFSFQVSMLRAVVNDLKYFISLYAFVIIMYGLIFSLLNIQTDAALDDGSNEQSYYKGVSYFGYFIMAFRASTGDFQVDNFNQLEDKHIIFAWIIWISAVLFLNIILLNFIIAVISESYDKVMQKMVAESYKIKCQLIKERELYYKGNDFKNRELFPRYLILRKPVQDNLDDENANEWQGFVKDIKRTIIKSQQQQMDLNKTRLDHLANDMNNRFTLLEKQVQKINETLAKNMEIQQKEMAQFMLKLQEN
eukprot:403359252